MKKQTKALYSLGLAAAPMMTGAIISSTPQLAIAHPPEPGQGKVLLTVLKATGLSKFDKKTRFKKKHHRPDFYLRITTNARQGFVKSGKMNNKTVAYFNYKLAVKPPKKQLLSYGIKLLDSDRFNRDDLADINPLPRKRELKIFYSPKSGLVFGPDGRQIGKHGQQITVKGNATKHRASITFRIDRTH